MERRQGEFGSTPGGVAGGRTGSPTADQVNQPATSAESLKQDVRATAERQKEAGVERLEGLADAVHGAADQLARQLPQAADYVHSAADRIERVSESLRNRSIEDLLQMAGHFARTQPAALFGGAVVAGIALSRYLKSSSDAARR